MKNIIIKVWKDSVGSKVIAAGVIFILSQICIFIWGQIQSINFLEVYNNLFSFLSSDYFVKGWYLILLYTSILTLFFLLIRKKKKQNLGNVNETITDTIDSEEINEPLVNEINEAPTVFFIDASVMHFIGQKKVLSGLIRKDIHRRLEILLRPPTKFSKAVGHGTTSDPIWWYQDSSALFIEHFRVLSRNKVLINFDEYNIEKIAAYRGKSYYRDFVYVQCLPDKPTGLYKHNPEVLKTFIKEHKAYREEYGIFKGKLITSQEYDDGATVIKGKPVRTTGAELRIRTLTKFNFIITSKTSPYNCDEFDRNSGDFFNKLLNEEIQFDKFVSWVEKLPKNYNDY